MGGTLSRRELLIYGAKQMWKMFTVMAVLKATLAASAPAHAEGGAFGFEFGQALPADAVPVQTITGGFLVKAPNPYPEFEQYAVRYSDRTGVCEIFGFGRGYANDDWGFEIKSAYEKLIGALSKKYGDFIRSEFILPDSTFDKENEFAISIHMNERFHKATWSFKSPPEGGVSEILLGVTSVFSTTRLYIHYRSYDHDTCMSAIDEASADAL